MLAQLLAKHGIGARVVPHAAISRRGFDVDTGGAALMCLSYLGLAASGSPTRLRQTIRRLRSQNPGTVVMVGLWPDHEGRVDDSLIRGQVGADLYVANLTEAVNGCLVAMIAPADLRQA